MTPLFNLGLAVLIPTLGSFWIIDILTRDSSIDLASKASLSYGLGLGIITLCMFVLDVLGISFSFLSIFLLFIIITAFLSSSFFHLFKSSVRFEKLSRYKSAKNIMTSFEKIVCLFLSLYILINSLFVFYQALVVPIYTWDAIATIGYKAKIFFFEKGIPPLNFLPHKSYPLFTPLAESWVAFCLNSWDDQLVKIIFPFFLVSFLTICYKFLRRSTRPLWSLLGCSLLLSSNLFLFHASISYRDFSLMYFNCTTIMLLLIWMEEKNPGILLLSGLFAGVASFTKLEGTAFMTIYLFIFLLITLQQKKFSLKEKLRNFFLFAVPSIGICVSFYAYKIFYSSLKDGTGTGDKIGLRISANKLLLLPHVFIVFIKNLLFSGNWGMGWFLFILSSFALFKKQIPKTARLLLISLFSYFLLYAFTAIFTTNYTWIAGANNISVLSRLLLHFFPLAPLAIILIFQSPDKKD